jgi:hypothetical protein
MAWRIEFDPSAEKELGKLDREAAQHFLKFLFERDPENESARRHLRCLRLPGCTRRFARWVCGSGKSFCARPLVRSINSRDRRAGFEAPALSGSCGTVAGSAVYSRCPRALARGVEYQAAMRRQPYTMLWVRPCKSAIDLALEAPRTRNCRRPRFRVCAFVHSAAAAPSL